jgi:hypothetical protein
MFWDVLGYILYTSIYRICGYSAIFGQDQTSGEAANILQAG